MDLNCLEKGILSASLTIYLVMYFTNTQIAIAELPLMEEVNIQPLEDVYLKVQRIVYFISLTTTVLVVAGLFYFIEGLRNRYVIIASATVLLLIFVISWIAVRLSFRYSGYALREKDVLYRSGWITRQTSIVPLNRVQHVSVQSGPIERKFDLASVSIYTAGAGQADVTIYGIKQTTALQIKDWITTQLHGSIN